MDDLHWMSAVDLAAHVRGGELSPVEIAEAMIERVAAVNPRLNAIVHHDPDAMMREAHALEAQVAAGETLGPLHGVPYAIKEPHDVAGVPTTNGVAFLADNVAAESDAGTERLAAAGGLYLGKTNAPEFGWKGTCNNHLFGATASTPTSTGFGWHGPTISDSSTSTRRSPHASSPPVTSSRPISAAR